MHVLLCPLLFCKILCQNITLMLWMWYNFYVTYTLYSKYVSKILFLCDLYSKYVSKIKCMVGV